MERYALERKSILMLSYQDDLSKLEELSIKISDLINENKFENILELDLQRKKIIQSISKSCFKENKNKISQIIDINSRSVSEIEKKITNLNIKNNKLKKRIKFYSLSK